MLSSEIPFDLSVLDTNLNVWRGSCKQDRHWVLMGDRRSIENRSTTYEYNGRGKAGRRRFGVNGKRIGGNDNSGFQGSKVEKASLQDHGQLLA